MSDDPHPPILAHQHRHVCGCGDYLVCSTELDTCCVTEPWMCSRCDMAERDAYFERESSVDAFEAIVAHRILDGVLLDVTSAEALGALVTTPHPGWSFWRNRGQTLPCWRHAFRGAYGGGE